MDQLTCVLPRIRGSGFYLTRKADRHIYYFVSFKQLFSDLLPSALLQMRRDREDRKQGLNYLKKIIFVRPILIEILSDSFIKEERLEGKLFPFSLVVKIVRTFLFKPIYAVFSFMLY